MNEKDHLFIKAFEHYLIANNKNHYNESKLVDLVDEYIDLYFDNIPLIKHGLPIYNLETLLQWCRAKFPKKINDSYSKIYNFIEKGNTSNTRYLSTAIYFLDAVKDDGLVNIANIYDKYMVVDSINDKDIYFYSDCFNKFLAFYKSNKCMEDRIKKHFVAFSLKYADLFDNFYIQKEFQNVRDYMDELKDYKDSDYKLIDDYLESANKKKLSQLKFISNDIPDEKREIVDNKIKLLSEKFKSMNSVEQINYLMFETSPFSIEVIKSNIMKNNKSLASCFNEYMLDVDGRIINYKKIKESEEFSLKAKWTCFTTINNYFKYLYSGFLKYFKIDNDFESYLNVIFTENKMVTIKRSKLLYEQFIDFFKGDYGHSVFNIVSEFEESLRHYLKSCGLNIKKRNCSGDVIGINDIFNDNKNNSFRDRLLEVIDEDYYFTFKWLLNDKYGFDLRNRASHRIKSTDLDKTEPAIYAILHIFRLYWFMQN